MPLRIVIQGLVSTSQRDISSTTRCWLSASLSSTRRNGGREGSGGLGLAQGCGLLGEAVHHGPVRILLLCLRVRRPLRDPHDEADDVAVHGAVALVVEITGEHAKQVRLPRLFWTNCL